MSGAAPYRESADSFGELREEYRGRWTGQLVFAAVSVTLVLVVVAWFSVSTLAGLGSFTAIAGDVRRGGGSTVLPIPFLLAFAGFLVWVLWRISGSIRRERVRFFERGLEIVDRKGGIRRCRFTELESVEIVDDRSAGGRGNVELAKLKLASGEVWAIGAWFDVRAIRGRLVVAIRASK